MMVDEAMDEGGAAAATPAGDTPPDRLSTNPRSPHFDEALLARGVGVRFKGRERRDVEEYCLSEGWIRVAAGKARDRYGNPLTIKLTGPLEVWFEDAAAPEAAPAPAPEAAPAPAPETAPAPTAPTD